MKEITFKQYIAKAGYKPVRVWKNHEGYYAQIKGFVSKPNPNFTQVMGGGTTVRLSLKDVDNPLIVGKDVKVVFEGITESHSKLRLMVREILSELDDELDEHNMTGNVDGYNTPSAFTKTDGTDVDAETDDDYVKRLNKSTGYVKVNENMYHVSFRQKHNGVRTSTIDKLIKFTKSNGGTIEKGDRGEIEGIVRTAKRDMKSTIWLYDNGSLYFDKTTGSKYPRYIAFIDKIIQSNEQVGESVLSENRYHDLRKSEGTPNQKIGVGIRELRKQLSEIEKFVSWYGNIKTENEMGYSDYWKRTQKHLSKISERLSKLSLKVRELSS